MGARAGLVAVGLVVVGLLGGCTGDESTSGGATTPTSAMAGPPVRLQASVQQQRLDVGTRRIGLELTNTANTSVHVSQVQLVSDAFAEQPATAKDSVFAPGATIDLVVEYGDPVCTSSVATDDAQVRVVYDVDGANGTMTLPVDGRGRGLLRRLHETGCAHQILEQAASVGYRLPFHRQQVDGKTALVGALTLTRPAGGGSGDRVVVRSLLGSVLFDFLPLDEGRSDWGVLDPGQNQAVLPVEIRSSDLCTQHGRSQSQQTFVWSAFLTVGEHPEYRQIVAPPTALQVQANLLLDDVCGE